MPDLLELAFFYIGNIRDVFQYISVSFFLLIEKEPIFFLVLAIQVSV